MISVIRIFGFLLLSGLLAGTALAKGPSFGGNAYSADKVKTLQVEIWKTSIDMNPTMGERGLHLKVYSDDGDYTVHVAPEWYVKKENISFSKGEKVTVTGSTFRISKGPQRGNNIFAATIVREGQAQPMMFRDEKSGTPLWMGRAVSGAGQGPKNAMQKEMQQKMQQQMQQQMMQKMMQQNMQGKGMSGQGGGS